MKLNLFFIQNIFLVAPYFRQSEEQTSLVVPSGRTLRLNCKAGGIPEPQVS